MKNQLQLTFSKIPNLKLIIAAGITCSVALSSAICAYSQNNTFFGANAGGSSTGSTSSSSSSGSSTSTSTSTSTDSKDDDTTNANAVLPGLNDTAPNTNPRAMGADFTGDEKRMQKKYKGNLNNAKNLIDKGTQMMESVGKNQNDPTYKKGKILKEIGEKSLAELKANSPFAVAGQKDK